MLTESVRSCGKPRIRRTQTIRSPGETTQHVDSTRTRSCEKAAAHGQGGERGEACQDDDRESQVSREGSYQVQRKFSQHARRRNSWPVISRKNKSSSEVTPCERRQRDSEHPRPRGERAIIRSSNRDAHCFVVRHRLKTNEPLYHPRIGPKPIGLRIICRSTFLVRCLPPLTARKKSLYNPFISWHNSPRAVHPCILRWPCQERVLW